MLAIFDLDGVVLDSAGLKVNSFVEVFSCYNIKRIPSKKELLLAPRPSKLFSSFFKVTGLVSEHYRTIYDLGLVKCSCFFPIERVSWLKNLGFNVALFTAQPRRRVEKVFSRSQIELFDAIITEDDFEGEEKKDGKGIRLLLETFSSQAVMVGDTLDDVLAAKKHGVISIFVSWGYSDKEDFCSDNCPDYIVNSPLELFLLLEKLQGVENENRLLRSS